MDLHELVTRVARRVAKLGAARPAASPPARPSPAPSAARRRPAPAAPALRSVAAARAPAPLRCPEHGARLSPLPAPLEALAACPDCAGVFVPSPLDRAVVDAPERFAALEASDRPSAPRPERPRYRPCPGCGHMMARQNFERVSGIIVDRCPTHGTWFDAGELAAALAFTRSGGAEKRAAFESSEAAWQARQKAQIEAWGREVRARRGFTDWGDGDLGGD